MVRCPYELCPHIKCFVLTPNGWFAFTSFVLKRNVWLPLRVLCLNKTHTEWFVAFTSFVLIRMGWFPSHEMVWFVSLTCFVLIRNEWLVALMNFVFMRNLHGMIGCPYEICAQLE
ncbi:uncharacterized protein G2W53_039901 [Senna tora]|uniref:Uncharacterized protein n=1 Tax=Senna tora TaxID=362788 RepID=A0A834W387_9FABA|nr:uncharacterized protein G2W53_039901 [Senna tora]